MDIRAYKRIVIVGNNGSGKSFLASSLSQITGLPLTHLDKEYWRPNWEATPRAVWIQKQIEFTSKEQWIIDGNHMSTLALRVQQSDLIIFLDIDRWVCLISIFKRLGKKRSDMPPYLNERIDLEFLRFIKCAWDFPKARRLSILELHNAYPDKPFFVIKSRQEMNNLLKAWTSEKNISGEERNNRENI